MDSATLEAAWADADNFIRIPDFGVNPQDVNFEGFAFPLVTPKKDGYWLRRIIYENVKTVRTLIRREKRSLPEVQKSFHEFLDLMEAERTMGTKIEASHNQTTATLYIHAMLSAERACDNSFGEDWRGTAQENLERCLQELATCAKWVQYFAIYSAKKGIDPIGEEEVMRDILSAMGRKHIAKRYETDPKQKAKTQVKECWVLWQADKKRYRGKAAFARDMREKFPELESQPVIEDWCRKWEKEKPSV